MLDLAISTASVASVALLLFVLFPDEWRTIAIGAVVVSVILGRSS